MTAAESLSDSASYREWELRALLREIRLAVILRRPPNIENISMQLRHVEAIGEFDSSASPIQVQEVDSAGTNALRKCNIVILWPININGRL